MRCAKRRHRIRPLVPRTAATEGGGPRPARDPFGLTGDTMVSAMDRVAPSLKTLYKTV